MRKLKITYFAVAMAIASGWATGAEPDASKKNGVVTFSEHVAPIVFNECASCHRPGEAAPFPLTNYEEVRKRGRMLKKVTGDGYMPPWHPVEGHGEFLHERRLSAEEIGLLAAWVDGGMPEGDVEKLPEFPDFPNGWRLGQPDLVVEMEEAFEVPADGPDIYRQFVLPLSLAENKWVRAVEVRANTGGALHHVLIYLDSSGAARRLDDADATPGFREMHRFKKSGSLGGWAVGSGPKELPEGLAMALPAGSDIVLASHFHPTGKTVLEKTKIGLFFADAPPERRLLGIQLPANFGIKAGINIPPGEKSFPISASVTLPVATELVSVGAHMHYLGKSVKAVAHIPAEVEGEPDILRNLFYIDDWDFSWQDTYRYREPVLLPEGTRIEVELIWDNSADNPHNQYDPPQRVRWGRESTDEMGSLSFVCVAADPSDHERLARAIGGKSSSLVGGENVAEVAPPRVATGKGAALAAAEGAQLMQLFGKADKNGDGILNGGELPASFRSRALMRWLDQDGDETVTRQEAESLRKDTEDAASGKYGPLFDRLDLDEDGVLRGEEIPVSSVGKLMMRRLDKNGDGELARGELPSSPAHSGGGGLLRRLLENRRS